MTVHEDLTRLLRIRGGVIGRDDVPALWVLRKAVRRGQLTRLYPRTYVESAILSDPHRRQDLQRRAALRFLGDRGVLSHVTALAIWRVGWDEPRHGPVHVSVPLEVRHWSGTGLLVHRRSDVDRLGMVRRAGVPVTSLVAALVDSWPLLPARDRPGLVIDSVLRRRVSIADLERYLALQPRLLDRAALRQVLRLLAAGCHSPLELWGALHVFIGPGMPALKRQYRVRAGGHSYLLDLYAERERVAFELDGAAFHGDRIQRERDLRRDAALAALGIQVIRFSYARLTSEPDAVRREVLAVLAARRRSLYV